jgi:hypothetical protein
MNIGRRTFLLGGSGLLLAASPAEQIVLGVIGNGGRGTFVMNVFQKHADVKVASSTSTSIAVRQACTRTLLAFWSFRLLTITLRRQRKRRMPGPTQ